MDNKQLFGMALGLQEPWLITSIEFSTSELTGEKELRIIIDFYKGSKFKGSDEKSYTAYDTKKREWRHLNFFQHKCYLQCDVPRIKKSDNKVEQVEVPWARPGSGFTLLFELFALELVKNEMPVNKVARTVSENANRIWTILNYYVDCSYARKDHSQVRQLGIDETSVKKGHNYITVGVDMEKREVLHVSHGKDKAAVEAIRAYLETKECPSEQIEQISLDMSPSFISGSLEQFPKANLTFDRFHVKKLLNEAMDKVRKSERKEHDLLKGHRYTFLKNENNLSEKQRGSRDKLLKLYPKLGEAYRLKILFDDLWDMKTAKQVEQFTDDWIEQVNKSKIIPFIEFTKTIQKHWYGIANYVNSQLTNGILEGINSKIQLAKRRARGFRDVANFITIIYLVAGKLDLNYPHKTL